MLLTKLCIVCLKKHHASNYMSELQTRSALIYKLNHTITNTINLLHWQHIHKVA